MPSIKLIKKASNTTQMIFYKDYDLEIDLLSFLQTKNIPIASSCGGEGVCKKCVINQDVLSCQVKLNDLVESKRNIEVSYL